MTVILIRREEGSISKVQQNSTASERSLGPHGTAILPENATDRNGSAKFYENAGNKGLRMLWITLGRPVNMRTLQI